MAGWWNLMLEVWRIDYMHKLGRMATTVILPLIIMIIIIVIIIIVTWRFQFECFVKDKTKVAQGVTWSSCNFGFPTQTWLLKNRGSVKEEMLLCIPRRAPQRSAASVSLMPAREKASESLCSVHLLHIYPLIAPPSRESRSTKRENCWVRPGAFNQSW